MLPIGAVRVNVCFTVWHHAVVLCFEIIWARFEFIQISSNLIFGNSDIPDALWIIYKQQYKYVWVSDRGSEFSKATFEGEEAAPAHADHGLLQRLPEERRTKSVTGVRVVPDDAAHFIDVRIDSCVTLPLTVMTQKDID